MSHKILAIAALASALTLSAAPAFAGEGKIVKQVEVDISDLDVTSVEGYSTVVGRIERAAVTACDYTDNRKPVAERMAEQTCMKNAIEGALGTLEEVRNRQAALKTASES